MNKSAKTNDSLLSGQTTIVLDNLHLMQQVQVAKKIYVVPLFHNIFFYNLPSLLQSALTSRACLKMARKIRIGFELVK